MIAKAKEDGGRHVPIVCGMAVKPNTEQMRRLNGKATWRVVGIDDYNIILKSEKPEDTRTLYFSAPTFLRYWKIVDEDGGGQGKPLIGDLVTPKNVAVLGYLGKAVFHVVGLDDGYVIIERHSKQQASRGKPRPTEWLARTFWVCFARAT